VPAVGTASSSASAISWRSSFDSARLGAPFRGDVERSPDGVQIQNANPGGNRLELNEAEPVDQQCGSIASPDHSCRRSDMFSWTLRDRSDSPERERSRDGSQVRDPAEASPRAARLFSRAAAALVWGLGLAVPAAAHASVQRTASVYTMSTGRIGAIVAALVGLIGAVIGVLAARSAGRIGNDNVRRRAIAALVLGSIGLVIGALVVATADGGLGTGNGLGGGVVAMTVGLIGMALGGRALARSRRTG
jgi:hypothetical protein